MKMNFITLWKLNDWGFYNRRDEALLSELSRRDEVESVLHVEHIPIREILNKVWYYIKTRDVVVKNIFRLHIRKAVSLEPICVKKERNYYIYSIVTILHKNNNIPILNKLNNFLLNLQYMAINKYFVRSKKNVVLITYPPSPYIPGAIKVIRHDLVIADFEDDLMERTTDQARKKEIEDNYRSILTQCQWIFSNTPEKDEKYREFAKQRIDYLPNGVDINLFSFNGKKVRRGERKVVGYVGNLNRTMDEDLLEHVISCYPEVDFVLIGHFENKKSGEIITRLQNTYSNFQFLGERNYMDIPGCIDKFDVLISFKKNDYTTAGGDSQKIYEYLATGKPIVTLPVPPADRFPDLMYVASDKFEFAEYLRKALDEDDRELREKRKKAAQANSWSKRVDVILDKVGAEILGSI